jgi:hypothetical protein
MVLSSSFIHNLSYQLDLHGFFNQSCSFSFYHQVIHSGFIGFYYSYFYQSIWVADLDLPRVYHTAYVFEIYLHFGCSRARRSCSLPYRPMVDKCAFEDPSVL